jgi:hypothetical protein
VAFVGLGSHCCGSHDPARHKAGKSKGAVKRAVKRVGVSRKKMAGQASGTQRQGFGLLKKGCPVVSGAAKVQWRKQPVNSAALLPFLASNARAHGE